MKFLAPLLAGLLAAALATPAAHAEKVLRYALRSAETGFDPAQISDLYSKTITAAMIEGLLEYDFSARPYRLRPNTAAALPEMSADARTFTLKVKPGIHFADDPAFKGQKRELTAQDYVYSLKRHYDPRWKSQNLYLLENLKILGLSELRKASIDAKKPFDYDREVEGLKALDRYTLQIRVADPAPRLPAYLTDSGSFGAVAREVVEFYGDKIMEHPVGTGPFKLGDWRRSSRIVLDRNPNYREVLYNEVPPTDDPRLAAEMAALQGKRMPFVDQVQIEITEEPQPRWLSFARGETDVIEYVPPEFTGIAMPGNKLAPNLAKQGIRMVRYNRPDISVTYYNMEDPVLGGYTPEKVALRRAINLAVDVDKEVRLPRRSQAMKAQGVVPLTSFGSSPDFKTEMGEYNLPKAKALLDLYGYTDKDGDGWRDQPDGKPLVLTYNTEPNAEQRALAELWQKNMDALGVRIQFVWAKWPENLKAATAGKLQMWGFGWSAAIDDGDTFLALGSSKSAGKANKPRFNLPAFEALYDKQKTLPDGPERLAVMLEAQKLLVAYAPYKFHVHRIWTDMAQPWVKGYNRNVYVKDFFKYVDIDEATAPKTTP